MTLLEYTHVLSLPPPSLPPPPLSSSDDRKRHTDFHLTELDAAFQTRNSVSATLLDLYGDIMIGHKVLR